MSNSAVFVLIANDGRADRLINATQLLNQRIKDIMCARKAAGMFDVSPTLSEIERTHFLPVNAHFKPLVAIGFEYNKCRTTSGSTGFGESMTFSIPQFGDFFNDMVLHWQYGKFSGRSRKAPTQATTATPGPGEYPQDAGTETYALVDAQGAAVNDGDEYQNLVRYVEYPAEAAIKKVEFTVNGNPLDLYTTETIVFLRKFTLRKDKEYGYNALTGQENVQHGYSDLQTNDVIDKEAGGAVVGSDTARLQLNVLNGPQTARLEQPEIELWHPLRFAFNENVALSIPSVSIPFGQRYITVDLNAQERVIQEVPNLYLKKTNAATTGTTVEYTALDGLAADTGSNELVAPAWKKAELWINNIFVNPEIHDIYIKRIGFTLMRVFRHHQTSVQTNADQILLSNLKWPIEYMFVGFRPKWNTKATNPNMWRDWHRMHKSDEVAFNQGAVVQTSDTEVHATDLVVDGKYFKQNPTVDQISIEAHGVPIYNDFEASFFNLYMPYHYGGHNIVATDDIGALMINFCLYPGTYQVSGHINVSRAREFYIKWASSYIKSDRVCDLLVTAIAINFLLITDGSAVMRYST
jgi:hypothetical protein